MKLILQDGQLVPTYFASPFSVKKAFRKKKTFFSRKCSFSSSQFLILPMFQISSFLRQKTWLTSRSTNFRNKTVDIAFHFSDFEKKLKLFFENPVYFFEEGPNFERYEDFNSFTLGNLSKFCNLDCFHNLGNLDILGNLGTVGIFGILPFLSHFCLFLAFLAISTLFVTLVFLAFWTFGFFGFFGFILVFWFF